MSNYNSWEDDPAAQDENLAQQAGQMNLGNNQAQRGAFRPAATSFTPGAATFQPGQPYGNNFVPQANQGYNPYAAQYGQQQQYGGYGNVYGQQGGYYGKFALEGTFKYTY
jgi:peptide chain release factor subunit 3